MQDLAKGALALFFPADCSRQELELVTVQYTMYSNTLSDLLMIMIINKRARVDEPN